jgi:hypothetical protein
VTTKDGKSYEGKVLSDDAEKVVIETTFDGVKELPKATVAKVDTTVPPLREQLAFRLGQAKDAAALADLAAWAKAKGFKTDTELVWRKVLELDPQNVKARKALGHVRVGGAWMTPEEKAAADKAAADAAQRAKGLVEHQGRWVTPAEKEALEKGLLKDGDEWIPEDEWHRRRGEQKVGGVWCAWARREPCRRRCRRPGPPLLQGTHVRPHERPPGRRARRRRDASRSSLLGRRRRRRLGPRVRGGAGPGLRVRRQVGTAGMAGSDWPRTVARQRCSGGPTRGRSRATCSPRWRS